MAVLARSALGMSLASRHRLLAGVLVAAVTAVATVLRVLDGAGQSIRLDEAQTIYFASFPLRAVYAGPYLTRMSIFKATAMDVHPPGYLLLMHFWMRWFGTSPEMLRLPSELAGALCVPAVYLLARVLYGRQAGVLAALLGALSPYWIWHAQEARMYPFLALFTVLSTYGLVKAMVAHRAWGWLVFVLFSVLGLHFHYFMALTLLAQGLWALTQLKRTGRGGRVMAAASALAIVTACVPWLVEVARAGKGSGDPILQAPDAYTPLILLTQFLFGYLAVPITSQLVAAWPLLVLVGLGLGVYGGRPSWRGALCWSLLLVPCLVTFGASLSWRPLISARYLIGVTPALYVLISQAAVRLLDRRRLAIAAAGVAPLLLAGNAVQGSSDQNPAAEDYRRAVNYIESNAESHDAVLLDSYYNRYPYSYYSRSTLPVYDVPTPPGFGASPQSIQKAGLPGYLRSISAGHTHLWVVYYLEYQSGSSGDVRHYLDYHTPGHQVIFGARFGRDDRRDPSSQTNVQLVRYDLGPSAPQAIQLRPPTETEVAAISGGAPSLRNPYAAAFDDRSGFGHAAPEHPMSHWYFPRLHDPTAQQSVSVFNPNPEPLQVALHPLIPQGQATTFTLPASSGADVQLSSLSAETVEAPLEVEAPEPVMASKVLVGRSGRLEFHGYTDAMLVQPEVSSRAWVTDYTTVGQPTDFSRPSCGPVWLWAGALPEPSGTWVLFRRSGQELTPLDHGSWRYDVGRAGDQPIAVIWAGNFGGGDLVARIDTSGGEGDHPPGRPAYFYMDCGGAAA